MRIQYITLPKKPDRANRCDFCMNKSEFHIPLGGTRSLIVCDDCYNFLRVRPRFNKKEYEKDVKNYYVLKNQIKDNMQKLKEYKSKL